MRARALLRTSIGVIAVAVAVSGSVATGATSTPVAGSAGIGDPYFPLDGNGGIDVRHYAIDDTYDMASEHLAGTTTLTIRAKEALSSFHLDLLLPVTDVSVDGGAASYAKPSSHELAITPASPIAAGQTFSVAVSYAGYPRNFSYAGEKNWLANDHEVVAMNEPHMAPWWFPSNDHPSDKATFDVSITTDDALQVVGNGVQVSRTSSGGQATTRWRESSPMTTYLAFFAAGHFAISRGTSASGVPWLTAVSRGFGATAFARNRRLVNQSGVITDWLQKELGRYPFDTTGGLVTTLDPGFALENQTRPTYPGWIDHSTVVHELAHQWFGDSVSLRRWKDIWLNEGFATYMEVRWRETHGGFSSRRWLRSWWGGASSSFWKLSIASPGVQHIWDEEIYRRGGLALAALRVVIGDHAFRRVLRTWAADHRHGLGTTAQFEALAQQVSGRNLHGFFKAWLVDRVMPPRTSANGW